SRLYDIIQSYRKEYSQQFLECFTLYDKRSNLKEALTLFTSFGTLISTFSALYLYLKYKLGFTTISSLSISILPSVIAHEAVLRVMQKLLDYDISLTSANVHSVEELIRRTERIFDLELSELERKIAEIDVVLKNFDKNSNQ
ncbi:MAG: hypothetical protein N3E37_01675, partial [Candidatus Micrarchaeota archaeon]|nr:hypothetical protein [Candidatus Micrarchaeota archaeon]